MVPRAARVLPVGRRGPQQLGQRLRRPGVGAATAGASTTTPICPSSRTWTGATPTCGRRCSTSCASGASAAPTASGSTRCASCSRTTSGATTRRTRPGATGDDPVRGALPEFTTDRPEVQDAIRAMRAAVGDERLLLGELYLPIERLVAYYASGLDMPANFHLLTHAVGRRARSPSWSSATRPRCRTARGRTGCSATTTARGWRAARPRPGARRRLPAADAARHADALLRRRARHARRRDPARAARRPVGLRQPRPGPHADAVGRRTARSPTRRAVAAVRARPRDRQRRRPARRPARCSRSTALLALRRERAGPRSTGAYRTLEADGDVLRFARGDSIEVRDRLRRRRRRDPRGRPRGPRTDR